jgi:hypothetical protein
VEAGEAEHVDEPAGSAGDAVLEQDWMDLAASHGAGSSEEVLADLEQSSQLGRYLADQWT